MRFFGRYYPPRANPFSDRWGDATVERDEERLVVEAAGLVSVVVGEDDERAGRVVRAGAGDDVHGRAARQECAPQQPGTVLSLVDECGRAGQRYQRAGGAATGDREQSGGDPRDAEGGEGGHVEPVRALLLDRHRAPGPLEPPPEPLRGAPFPLRAGPPLEDGEGLDDLAGSAHEPRAPRRASRSTIRRPMLGAMR